MSKVKIILIMIIIAILASMSGLYYNKTIMNSRIIKPMALNTSRGTIINVPIDSRPITTNNFEYLTKAAGYEYITIGNNKLDSMTTNGVYQIGNSGEIRAELWDAMFYSNYNSSNNTVIINCSSYFFGGLIGTRNANQYVNRENKINDLRSLISTYNNPNYYVVINMPRILPDSRVTEFPISKENNSSYGNRLTSSTLVKGLQDYYNGTDTTTTRFDNAVVDADNE